MKVFPDDWQVLAANTVCSEIVDCLNKTAPTVEHDTGFRMVRTTNVRNGRVSVNDNRFVDEAVFTKWTRRARPKYGDIILSREAPLGEVGLLRSDTPVFLGQRTMLYRADPSKLDQYYLFHQMNGPYVQSVIQGKGQGSTVAHLRVPDAETLPIPVAPLKVQRKIAAILTTYDDLIEVNHRRIAVLEKMAEEIYREWFVRFRFSGYKTAQFHVGYPSDWKPLKVGEIVCRLKFGRIYRRDELQNEGRICVIDQSTDDFLGFYDGEPEHDASNDAPILLFGDHSCKMVFMTKPFSLAENVVPFIPKDPESSAYFLFHLVRDLTRTIEYKRHWKDLTTREVLVPTPSFQRQFELVVKPLHEQVSMLAQSNRLIAKSRDLLLPRLISGKLRVDALDIQFPPSIVSKQSTNPSDANY